MTDNPEVDDVVIELVHFRTRKGAKFCRHQRLLLIAETQLCECKDCGEMIGPFKALEILSRIDGDLARRWKRLQAENAEMEDYVPHLKAAKKVEHLWRGKWVPCCPHCGVGITAEEILESDKKHGKDWDAKIKTKS